MHTNICIYLHNVYKYESQTLCIRYLFSSVEYFKMALDYYLEFNLNYFSLSFNGDIKSPFER